MDNFFTEISCEISILNQQRYEKDTNNKLEDTAEEQVFILEEFKPKVDKSINNHSNKINLLEIANVETTNTFIAESQKAYNNNIEKQKKRIANADIDFPYIKAELMTNAEIQLFHFMKNNLCKNNQILIFPKVRLGDLVQLDKQITTDMKYFWKVTNKHVDYVICRADTLKVMCVVELDDYTHDTAEAIERDQFVMQVLKVAGIDTYRIKTRIRNISVADLELIDECINKEFAPPCPYCGMTMIPRKCMSGRNKGHRFYGCPNYINDCRKTIDIDIMGENLP